MTHISLFMPDCGAAGVIVAVDDKGRVVEFRGRPYSEWDLNENTPMYQVHSLLRRINISNLHANGIEVATQWHPEYPALCAMFFEALRPQD